MEQESLKTLGSTASDIAADDATFGAGMQDHRKFGFFAESATNSRINIFYSTDSDLMPSYEDCIYGKKP